MKIIPHCSLILHFEKLPNEIEIFFILINHLYCLFYELSLQDLTMKNILSIKYAHDLGFLSFFFLVFLPFLGPFPQHMEVPRLGVESELQPPAYATATATQDLSCICDLHYCSQQYQILNPLSEARNRTRNLMVPSRTR